MSHGQMNKSVAVAYKFANTIVRHEGFECRPLHKQDLKDLASWPKFENELSWANFPASTKDLQDRWYRTQLKSHVAWISVRHDIGGQNTLIGRCSLTQPLTGNTLLYGIVVRRDMIEQGLGTEITKIMLQYAFQVTEVDRVWLESRHDNPRAHRVWTKIGFIPLGTHYRREVFGRYDLYYGFEFLRSQCNTLPQIEVTIDNELL